MKRLLVMRHAKSSWDNPQLADHDRPLNKRGKRDAPRMGRWLNARDLNPEMIVTSSAERALSTAQSVADSIDIVSSIQVERDLYHGGPEAYMEYLRLLSDKISLAMVIGHNPDLEEFVEDLVGRWHRLPTAAVALIDLPIMKWKELSDETEGSLISLWLPKEIEE
jgi:phosphohistidine phosphatase